MPAIIKMLEHYGTLTAHTLGEIVVAAGPQYAGLHYHDIQNALEIEITTRPGGVSRVRLVSVEELQKPAAERLWEITPL